ncbi:MAG: HlyD family efflux transporter periplasmic adaptor subunit, partial [Acidobacteriota bacterium]
VRLDRSKSEDELSAQKITWEKAKAAKIQAEEEFEVAKISVEEYLKGTFVKEQQDLEAQITISLENLRSAQNLLAHTERMAKKGFVTPLQLEADRFAVQRAELELGAAKTAKMVLDKYSKAKTLRDLESQRDTAEARKNSEQAAYELELARKERLEEQLKHCEITAPQKGMVVYANDSGGRFSQAVQIEEGSTVREQQTIVRLPDLSNMQVKVLVHETKVEQIRPRMLARIDIMDRQMKGAVVSIANQAERGSFFSADVKEYETIVRIEGESKGLRPGMSAQVEILVENLENVLTVPVQAVVEQRGKFCCWVQTPEGPTRRLVLLGRTNNRLIEIKDGVAEGEDVLLNPRSFVSDASEEEPADKDADRKDSGPPPDGGVARPERSAGREAVQPRPSNTQGVPPGEAGPPKKQPGRKPPGDGGTNREQRPDLMQSDKDGDGKVSRDEAPERMRTYFDRLDSNRDGFIDKAEIDARPRRRQNEAGPTTGRKSPGEGP